jgi:mannose-6-phosphate isomerase-like protein (cupin superfamily)
MIRRRSEMRRETRERMRGGEGTVAFEHLFEKDEFKARVRLCSRLSLPPGAGIGPHAHEGEDEVYIVLSGAGLLDEGQGPVRVSAGDAVLTGRGQSHAIRNDGAEPLELIAVIACY